MDESVMRRGWMETEMDEKRWIGEEGGVLGRERDEHHEGASDHGLTCGG